MSERTIVSTEGAPAAIGPYSQGVIGAGLVHCSGQIAMDPATGEVVGDDAATQAEGAGLSDQVEALEKAAIERALEQTECIQSQAAELLGLTERNLRYKLRKYGFK